MVLNVLHCGYNSTLPFLSEYSRNKMATQSEMIVHRVQENCTSEKWHSRCWFFYGWLCDEPFVFKRSMTETLNASCHTVIIQFYFERICFFFIREESVSTRVRQNYARFTTSEAIFTMSFIFHMAYRLLIYIGIFLSINK